VLLLADGDSMRRLTSIVVLCALVAVGGTAALRGQSSPVGAATPVVMLVAVDSRGIQVSSLGRDDFAVTVDGQPRQVLRVGYVFRGPGSEPAARRAGGAGRVGFAEPVRTVVVAVDESRLARGAEAPVREAVGALLDRLGPSDLVAIVRLPESDARVRPTADRKAARKSLGAISGRAAPAMAVQPDQQLRVGDGERAPASRYVTPSGDAVTTGRSDSAPSFGRLLDKLREIPGPKTVLVVAPMEDPDVAGDGSNSRNATIGRLADAAASAQATVHAVLLPRGNRETGSSTLERVAVQSGGIAVTLGRDASRELDRLAAGMAGAYALFIEGVPGDRPLHDVQVTTNRTAVRILAAQRWLQGALPVGIVTTDAASSTDLPGASARPATGTPAAEPASGTTAAAPDPELDLTLARVDAYLQSYLRNYTNIVAEERYDQRLEYPSNTEMTPLGMRPRTDGGAIGRVLKSDLLMVSTPSLGRWLPFRDVFEVDGKPVRDREDRLKKLFLDAPANALNDARRITEESARYNLGSVDRTINVPTLPLELLSSANRPRLRLVRRGEESIEGTQTRRIDFEERPGATLIRTTSGQGVPSRGSFWVDPLTGTVVRTLLRTETADVKTELSVTYRHFETVGLWLPSEMNESYTQPHQKLKGVARYSNVRRFQVTTDQTIKAPAASPQ
jgi:hypothetical protein